MSAASGTTSGRCGRKRVFFATKVFGHVVLRSSRWHSCWAFSLTYWATSRGLESRFRNRTGHTAMFRSESGSRCERPAGLSNRRLKAACDGRTEPICSCGRCSPILEEEEQLSSKKIPKPWAKPDVESNPESADCYDTASLVNPYGCGPVPIERRKQDAD